MRWMDFGVAGRSVEFWDRARLTDRLVVGYRASEETYSKLIDFGQRGHF